MKLMMVKVNTSPNHSSEFLVGADNAKQAINSVNSMLRAEIKTYKEKEDSNGLYKQKIEYIRDWLNALRRYKRKYKPKFGGCFHNPVIVYEIPVSKSTVYSISYFQLGCTGPYISNLLPEIPLSAAKYSQD